MRSLTILTVQLVLIATASAFAEEAKMQRQPVRGVIEQHEGGTLTVKDEDGKLIAVTLSPEVQVAGVVKRKLSDIKTGDYVSSAAVRGPEGDLRALEVHIFPEALRGQNEGQFPWDLAPGAIMTNATVKGVTAAPEGRTLRVTYHGSATEIDVMPGTPIVSFEPLQASALEQGKSVFLLAMVKDDGALSAAQVVLEKDGVKPPM